MRMLQFNIIFYAREWSLLVCIKGKNITRVAIAFPPIGTGQVSYANGQIQTNGSPDIDWNSQARRSFQSFLVQGSSQPKHSTTITCINTNQHVMSITKGESNLQAYC